MTEKISQHLLIRLPNEYMAVVSTPGQPFTLKEYDEQILSEATKRFAACAADKVIADNEFMKDAAFYGLKPLTRWQKFKRRIADYKQRYKDIWTILCGRDVHEDCGQ